MGTLSSVLSVRKCNFATFLDEHILQEADIVLCTVTKRRRRNDLLRLDVVDFHAFQAPKRAKSISLNERNAHLHAVQSDGVKVARFGNKISISDKNLDTTLSQAYGTRSHTALDASFPCSIAHDEEL